MKKLLSLTYILLAFCLVACGKHDNEDGGNEGYDTPAPITTIASLGTPEDNEIWFTVTDGKELWNLDKDAFNVAIEDIIYAEDEGGISIIRFVGSVTTIDNEAFDGCFNISNISLPNSVQRIGDKAFYNCTNIKCLTLGSEISQCGKSAFEGCYNLYSLHIPSIESWCNISFANQSANPLYFAEHIIIDGVILSELNIPEGIEEISQYAFYDCKQLTSVYIPQSVQRIGNYAFHGCDNIGSVKISDITAWCKIDFENESANPLAIAKVLYKNEAQVSRVSITSVTEIFSYAFINCTTIQTFSADDYLMNIGKDAFRNCSALTTVSIGKNIEYIGEQAFYNCNALNRVTCHATYPPMLGNEDVFSRNGNGRKFYVPSEVVDTYKSDSYWSKYADSIKALN